MVRYLFVYGTLKKGYGNHRLIERHHGKFVEKATVQQFVIIDTHGAFPYLVQSADWMDGPTGELYEFADGTSFHEFDQLEMGAGYVPQLVNICSIENAGDYHTDVLTYVKFGCY